MGRDDFETFDWTQPAESLDDPSEASHGHLDALYVSSIWMGILCGLGNLICLCVLVSSYHWGPAPAGAYPMQLAPPKYTASLGGEFIPARGLDAATRRLVIEELSADGLSSSEAAALDNLLGDVGKSIFPAGNPPSRKSIADQLLLHGPILKDESGAPTRYFFTTGAGRVEVTSDAAAFIPLRGNAVRTGGCVFIDEKGASCWSAVECNRAIAQCRADLGGRLNPLQAAALAGELRGIPISANRADSDKRIAHIEISGKRIAGKATAVIVAPEIGYLWLLPEGQVIVSAADPGDSLDPNTGVAPSSPIVTRAWSRQAAQQVIWTSIIGIALSVLLFVLAFRARTRDRFVRQAHLIHASVTVIFCIYGLIALLDFSRPFENASSPIDHSGISVFQGLVLGLAGAYAVYQLITLNQRAKRDIHRSIGEGRSLWEHRIWESKLGRLALMLLAAFCVLAIIYFTICMYSATTGWDLDGTAGVARSMLAWFIALGVLAACIRRLTTPLAALAPPPLARRAPGLISAVVLMLFVGLNFGAAPETQPSEVNPIRYTDLQTTAQHTRDPQVRNDALHELAAQGLKNPDAAKALLQLVGSADAGLSRDALIAAHHGWTSMPIAYLDVLKKLIHDSGLHARLCEVLKQQDRLASHAAAHLLTFESQSDPDVAEWSRNYTKEASPKLAGGKLNDLIEIFHDGDSIYARSAAFTLLNQETPEGTAAVVAGLKDQSPSVRSIAVQALRAGLSTRPAEVQETIRQMQLHDKDEMVRSAARYAIRMQAQAVTDHNTQQPAQRQFIVPAANQPDVAELKAAVDHARDPQVRFKPLHDLAYRGPGDPEAARVLLSYIAGPDSALSHEALIAAYHGWRLTPNLPESFRKALLVPATHARLCDDLKDADRQTEHAAAYLLFSINLGDPDATDWRNVFNQDSVSKLQRGKVEDLVELFHDGGDTQYSRTAARRLVALKTPQSTAALAAGLDDPSPLVRQLAVTSLRGGFSNQPEIQERISQMALHDPDPLVRPAARWALGQPMPPGTRSVVSGHQASPPANNQALVPQAGADRSIPELKISAEKSNDRQGRTKALQELAAQSVKNPDAAVTLLRFVKSSDASLSREALLQAYYGWPALSDSLRDIIKTEIEKADLHDALCEFLHKPDRRAAYAASQLLSIGDPSDPQLTEWTRTYKQDATERIGRRNVQDLIEIFQDGGMENTPSGMASRELVRLNQPAATAAVVAGLADSSPYVRSLAILALASNWSSQPADVRESIQQMETQDPNSRVRAVARIARSGQVKQIAGVPQRFHATIGRPQPDPAGQSANLAAFSQIRAAAEQTGDAHARSDVLEKLASLGIHDAGAAQTLFEIIASTDPALSQEALIAADNGWAFPTRPAVVQHMATDSALDDRLYGYLYGPDRRSAHAAAHLLAFGLRTDGRLREWMIAYGKETSSVCAGNDLQALAQIVHDADTQSEHAIMRLLVIKRPESIALVVDTLKDPSPLLRRYAVQDLGFYLRACPPDVADTIANMQVHDPDERVRAAASVATRQIAQWTAIVHPEIARQAREQAQAREAALQAAQALARRDAALPLLTDANPRHRASALIDLRGDPPADRIIPLLSDEDPVVRRQLDTELATNPLLVTRIKALGSPGVNALTLAALDSASARAALRSIQPPPSIVSSAVAQPTVVVAPAPAFSPLGWLGELSWYGALICLVGFAIAVIVQLARTGRLTTLLAPGAAPPVPDWLRELPPTAQVAPAPSQPGP